MKILDSLALHMHRVLILPLDGTFIAHSIPEFPPADLAQMGLPLIVGWRVQNGGMEFPVAILAPGMLFLTKGNKV